jgi:hypothetical protein
MKLSNCKIKYLILYYINITKMVKTMNTNEMKKNINLLPKEICDIIKNDIKGLFKEINNCNYEKSYKRYLFRKNNNKIYCYACGDTGRMYLCDGIYDECTECDLIYFYKMEKEKLIIY